MTLSNSTLYWPHKEYRGLSHISVPVRIVMDEIRARYLASTQSSALSLYT